MTYSNTITCPFPFIQPSPFHPNPSTNTVYTHAQLTHITKIAPNPEDIGCDHTKPNPAVSSFAIPKSAFRLHLPVEKFAHPIYKSQIMPCPRNQKEKFQDGLQSDKIYLLSSHCSGEECSPDLPPGWFQLIFEIYNTDGLCLASMQNLVQISVMYVLGFTFEDEPTHLMTF